MVSENAVPPRRILAVVLGASEFPDSGLAASPAFRAAAVEIADYLSSGDGLNIPEANLLWLFDSANDPNRIDQRIVGFLRERSAALTDEGAPPNDLLIFYVGHGFFDERQEYRLALRITRASNLRVSSLGIVELNTTVQSSAGRLRTYFVLDACFSAAAARIYQSGDNALLSRRLKELPGSGLAILCSAPSDTASYVDGETTLFSGALLDVLWNGSSASAGPLTLNELCASTYERILQRRRADHEVVRPEVHVPIQPHGDIAKDVRLFPNNPRGTAQAAALRQSARERIRQRIAFVDGEAPKVAGNLVRSDARPPRVEEELRVALSKRRASRTMAPPNASEIQPARSEAEEIWNRPLRGELIDRWLSWKLSEMAVDDHILSEELTNIKGEIASAEFEAGNLYDHLQAAEKSGAPSRVELLNKAWLERAHDANDAKRRSIIKQDEIEDLALKRQVFAVVQHSPNFDGVLGELVSKRQSVSFSSVIDRLADRKIRRLQFRRFMKKLAKRTLWVAFGLIILLFTFKACLHQTSK